LEIARALNWYLRESRQFEYSEAGQKRTAGVDPLEDFITTNRRGHCEYFAGALALMLRSQGIPARVAIGFRASEYNSPGNYYQVRQLHAHAWVEALLKPEDIAGETLHEGPDFDWSEGAWLTLDPTAYSASALDEESYRGLWRRARMYVNYLQVLWGRFVSGLNATSQSELIYAPLAALFSNVWQGFVDLLNNFGLPGWLTPSADEETVTGLTSPPGALAGFLSVFAGLVTILLAGRRGRQWLRRAGRLAVRRFVPAGPRASTSEIYGRLERVLARYGYRRAPGQTPYEFAISAGGELAERPGCNPLATLPRRVVEAFYRVRFGCRELDSAEAQAVEHALSALERGLVQAPAGG
jgi:hypothetical protein